jgi:hypothetical protein
MQWPDYFHKIPSIPMSDPLSAFLGASPDGKLSYSYADAVNLAGHSCPTVAGAYLMTLHALKHLYKDELPVRGQIAVDLREPINSGVTGVIANVVSLITGAAGAGGFKGIGGQFQRCNLLNFDCTIESELRFRRLDTGASIGVDFDASSILPDEKMGAYLQTLLQGQGDEETRLQFGTLWQERVERIMTSKERWPEMLQLR